MNFRRQPFQFTSIDPVKRHAELQKRFGLPSDEMFVDCVNPGTMGAMEKDSLINSSPRLQHRVPVFSQGDHSTKSAGVQNNIDNGHQPRVRVVPIHVEGVNEPSRRHRTFSGPANITKGSEVRVKSPDQMFNPQFKSGNAANKIADQPRVCNIPIELESREKSKESLPKHKDTVIPTVVERKEQTSDCSSDKCLESDQDPFNALKQIEIVLSRLKGYQVEVENFTGRNKDKQYRYLDEMLTRCMLDLDNVDTLGKENVRQSRKNAVKQVQACIDLLETKVTTQVTIAETTESVPMVKQVSNTESDIEMKECDFESVNTDMELEKENSVEDTVTSRKQTQAWDVDMEDKSIEDQSAITVINDPDKNITKVEGQSSDVIEKMSYEVKSFPDQERDFEGVTHELVNKEMYSDDEKSSDQERSFATEVETESIVSEQNCSELSELSKNYSASNEQISTSSSNKCDQTSSLNDTKDREEISASKVPNEDNSC